ncbi:hypothetical protein BGW38_006249 [Lunasporangiospora selenospora]|uniref:F-box domain-containing protein n=1 Tax=Lunasporangiospora selenospora TaxID=979761 RepID=A0A9P6FZ48_9FUNG|nr:hypothetical protein BGW38_006249 [Lunasporangiospora selenospora]
MTKTDTVLQMPEILLHIARFLPPSDQAQCSRVCRRWFAPFASELWRFIQPDQFTHEALVEALPRYSSFIRQLRCGTYDSLQRLSSDCTQLTVLVAPGIYQGNIKSISAILERNPGLEELEIRNQGGLHLGDRLDFLLLIASKLASSLKSLDIRNFRMPHGVLAHILESLLQLESLGLESWSEYTLTSKSELEGVFSTLPKPKGGRMIPEPMAPFTPTEASTLHDQQEIVLCRSLKSLKLYSIPDTLETTLLVASYAPNLEAIFFCGDLISESISTNPEDPNYGACVALRTLCPRLNHLEVTEELLFPGGLLRLVCIPFANMTHLSYLVSSMDVRLFLWFLLWGHRYHDQYVKLYMEVVHSADEYILGNIYSGRPYVETSVEWLDTLETVYVYEGSKAGRPAPRNIAAEIVSIMSSFSRLKILSVSSGYVNVQDLLDWCDKDGANGSGGQEETFEWVCMNLMELRIAFRCKLHSKWLPKGHRRIIRDLNRQKRSACSDGMTAEEDKGHPVDRWDLTQLDVKFTLFWRVLRLLRTLPNLDLSTIKFE